MSPSRPTARVSFGPIALGPARIGEWTYELYLTRADGDDMVTIYVRGLQPSRMGTVTNPAHARVEDVHLTAGMFSWRLTGEHGEQLLAAVRTAYGAYDGCPS